MQTASRDVKAYFAPDLLEGEVAIVTGGASGIGKTIATAFTGLGCDVAIASRSAERLEAAASAISAETGRLCSTFVCDIRDDEAVRRLYEQVVMRYGPPTILVNNAAANFAVPAERMTRRALETVLEIDVVGTFNVTRAAVDDMIARRSGVILNMIISEPERGFPGFAHAGAAKAAVQSLTCSWAREWGRYGIRVNAIGPGPVPTEGVSVNMKGIAGSDDGDRVVSNEEFYAGVVDRIALGRLGTTEEIAAAAVFLCSPAASWITGVTLNVSGGLSD